MEIGEDEKFLFLTMLQAALKIKDMGKTEKDFLRFSKGIWETTEMNNAEELKKFLFDGPLSAVEIYEVKNEN